MKPLIEVDPYLHLLRGIVWTTVGNHRTALETARRHLYKAFLYRDPDRARAWAKSLRACIAVHMPAESRDAAIDAIDAIDAAIEWEPSALRRVRR